MTLPFPVVNQAMTVSTRPLLLHLNEKLQVIYTASLNMAIDERLVLWKGLLVLRQYILMKWARFGIKHFICENTGYT